MSNREIRTHVPTPRTWRAPALAFHEREGQISSARTAGSQRRIAVVRVAPPVRRRDEPGAVRLEA